VGRGREGWGGEVVKRTGTGCKVVRGRVFESVRGVEACEVIEEHTADDVQMIRGGAVVSQEFACCNAYGLPPSL